MPKSMPNIPFSLALSVFNTLNNQKLSLGPHSCPLHTQLPTQHVALYWLRRWLLLEVLNGSHAQYTLCYWAVNHHWGDRWCHQGSGDGEGEREKERRRPMGWWHIGLEFGHAGLLKTKLLHVFSSVCPWPEVWPENFEMSEPKKWNEWRLHYEIHMHAHTDLHTVYAEAHTLQKCTHNTHIKHCMQKHSHI